MCPECGMPSGHDYFCPRRHGRPASDDHNERPVTAREYRWLHQQLLLLAGRVDALEGKLESHQSGTPPEEG